LETAIHAPSPHNVQPWRVKILSEREAALFIDTRRTLPKEDVTGSFIILTMGMFIEALIILASRKSYSLEYELVHEPDWYMPHILEVKEHSLLPFARLRLVEKAVTPEPYDERLFFKRRTSRVSLLPAPLPNEVVHDLKNLATAWGQCYEQTTDAAQIERILEKNTQALFEDMNSPDYHDEITEWFRFTDKQEDATRDGLSYRCMNTGRFNYWMAARMPRVMLTPVLSRIFARVYRSQLGIVPTIGMLSGGFWKPSDAIQTGRFLMRFWLETARHDLYIHPYGNMVTNKKAAVWMKEETGVKDIWLIFKIGYSPEPPKSLRLPLEEILVSNA